MPRFFYVPSFYDSCHLKIITAVNRIFHTLKIKDITEMKEKGFVLMFRIYPKDQMKWFLFLDNSLFVF